MEADKKKRKIEPEASRKRKEDGAGRKMAAPPPPADEEVEEFYTILKRIQVAIKYFQRRDAVGAEPTAKSWSPSFEQEDFDGVKKDSRLDLDLNAQPPSDVSDSA